MPKASMRTELTKLDSQRAPKRTEFKYLEDPEVEKVLSVFQYHQGYLLIKNLWKTRHQISQLAVLTGDGVFSGKSKSSGNIWLSGAFGMGNSSYRGYIDGGRSLFHSKIIKPFHPHNQHAQPKLQSREASLTYATIRYKVQYAYSR